MVIGYSTNKLIIPYASRHLAFESGRALFGAVEVLLVEEDLVVLAELEVHFALVALVQEAVHPLPPVVVVRTADPEVADVCS